MLSVLFFGRLKDIAGVGEMRVDKPVDNIVDLIAHLRLANPALAEALQSDRVKTAVNGQIVAAHSALADGDEIAFLPPVSGG